MPNSRLLTAYREATRNQKVRVVPAGGEIDALAELDAIYADKVQFQSVASGDVTARENVLHLDGESVSFAATEEGLSEWLKSERERLGLPETHKNALYLECVMTHSNKVMQNAWRDILLPEEVDKAIATLLFQPVDAQFYYNWWDGTTEGFTRHERERMDRNNGIRGVIFAAKHENNEVRVGIIIWYRDFPLVAEAMIADQEFLGSSFDLIGEKASHTAEGSRQLHDITFFGCTIIYKAKAGDRDTSISGLEYMGEPRKPNDSTTDGSDSTAANANAGGSSEQAGSAAESTSQEGQEMPQDPKNSNGSDQPMTPEQTLSAQAAKIGGLESKVSTLESEKTALTTERDALQTEVTSLTEKLSQAEKRATDAEAERDTLKSEQEAQTAARLTTERMGELLQIGEFKDEPARAEMEKKVGTLDETQYALAKAEHELDVLKRKSAGDAPATASGEEEGTASAAPAVGVLGAANLSSEAGAVPDDPRALGKACVRTSEEK